MIALRSLSTVMDEHPYEYGYCLSRLLRQPSYGMFPVLDMHMQRKGA